MRIELNARNLVLQTLPKRAVGVEIGVHKGDFSARLLGEAKPKKLFLVDPYKHFEEEGYEEAWYGGKTADGQKTMDDRYASVQNRFKRQISRGQVQIIRELSADAASQFEDESLDFVYIDGDHTFDGVLADIKSYLPKVKTGGLILGDDYYLGEWWGAGVVKAFAKCLHEDPLKIEFVMDNQICCRKVDL